MARRAIPLASLASARYLRLLEHHLFVRMTVPIAPLVLENRWVRLEPFAENHRAGLAAYAEDADVWRYATQAPFEPWFDASLEDLAAGRSLPFAVRRLRDGILVGTSRYLNVALSHLRLEIGNTWYGPDARRSTVNPAAKLLLMGHAFETLKLARVEFKVDARNLASRAAMKKLGAVEEGILRHHVRLPDGFLRDSVYFSVLAGEWPNVRRGLEARLAP